MPKLDRTGPSGAGPRTGRGLGPCGMGLGWRRGFGAGRGLGRFFGWGRPQTEEDQKATLTEYKKALEEELEDINKELK